MLPVAAERRGRRASGRDQKRDRRVGGQRGGICPSEREELNVVTGSIGPGQKCLRRAWAEMFGAGVGGRFRCRDPRILYFRRLIPG